MEAVIEDETIEARGYTRHSGGNRRNVPKQRSRPKVIEEVDPKKVQTEV
jgi:hypothetical protein